MSQLLKGSNDSDKLEWLRDLVLGERTTDKQMLLTALRWALDFGPARVDALEHELLAAVFALVAECYNHEAAHPAVKGLALKVLADALRAFGEHAEQNADYVARAADMLASLMTQLVERANANAITPVDELLLRNALDLGDSLAKHGLISGQRSLELFHVATALQGAVAAGQFAKTKLDVFELSFLFAFHCARSPRESCPAPNRLSEEALIRGVRQCCDQILSGTLHHVFPRCIAALLAFDAWCAADASSPAIVESTTDDDHMLVYLKEAHERQAVEGTRAVLAMLIELIRASAMTTVSQKQKMQSLMECLRAVLVACQSADATAMMDDLVSLLGALMNGMKASLKARPSATADASDFEPKAQRKAAGDVRRECVECARVALGSVHGQWILSHEDALFDLSTAQLSSPLLLVGACKSLKHFQQAFQQGDADADRKADDEQDLASAEAVINRCIDHLSRAMAKIDKYSAAAAVDVLSAVQQMAELGLHQMFTVDKHQTLRLVVYSYCMRSGAEMKMTALQTLAACLDACCSLHVQSPSEEMREFVESVALRIFNDMMLLHRATFIVGEQASQQQQQQQPSAKLQVEGLQAHEHTVDVLCSLVACIVPFTRFLMTICFAKDENTGVTSVSDAPLRQFTKEHTIENFAQLEKFLREALGVAPTFEDDFQLLQMEAEILVNLTLLLFGSMQGYKKRVTDTARSLTQHATTIRGNPFPDHQCVFSVFKDEFSRLLQVVADVGGLDASRLDELRAEFPGAS